MLDAACVVCRRPVDPPWRPFCSERCKLLDLGRWVGGEYRIPGPHADAGEENPAEQGDPGDPGDKAER